MMNFFSKLFGKNQKSCDEESNIEPINKEVKLNFIKKKEFYDTAVSRIKSICISNDEKYLILGGEQLIEIWDFQKNVKIKNIDFAPDHSGYGEGKIEEVTISQDNKYLIAGGGDEIKIWDFNNYDEINSFNYENSKTTAISSIAVTNDNKFIIAGTYNKEVLIFDFKKSLATYQAHASDIFKIILSSDNKYLISCGADCTVYIWDFDITKQNNFSNLQFKDEIHTESIIESISISADNKYIGLSDRNCIVLYEFDSLSEVIKLPKSLFGAYPPTGIKLANKNEFILGFNTEYLKLFSLKEGEELITLNEEIEKIRFNAVDISNKNNVIVIGGHGKFAVYYL